MRLGVEMELVSPFRLGALGEAETHSDPELHLM